ncbi:MAG TPA: Mur ligase family protein [Bacteroidales bacterium]|nr:Mur ligase family protein [Bacteroidales bacterium]
MHIHFIAIGGAAMHSLAIALQQKGYTVTGSDDEIFDPARAQLLKAGLLPLRSGWFPDKIFRSTGAVVLGMHARKDNPELLRAQELGIRVYSYPEFLYRETKGKTRVVIAGSHGKTTITAMVMHVLKHTGFLFDYMAGSRLEGFDNMVRLETQNKIAVFEGDEYLSSCMDPRPKFHLYQPHIALISGIAWDHINVFPTHEAYVNQFRIFIENMPPQGCVVYCQEDPLLESLVETGNPHILKLPYTTPEYRIGEDATLLISGERQYAMQVFGRHNMQNIMGAKLLCNQLGVKDEDFFRAVATFRGAGKRLQLMGQKSKTAVFLDFAHSPSKVEATVKAVREQYPGRKLVACLELHTFSSLNRKFLGHYNHTLDPADKAAVFFDPQTILHKKLKMLSVEDVQKAFKKEDLQVFNKKDDLESFLEATDWENSILLLMSSGNFSGIDFKIFAERILLKIS